MCEFFVDAAPYPSHLHASHAREELQDAVVAGLKLGLPDADFKVLGARKGLCGLLGRKPLVDVQAERDLPAADLRRDGGVQDGPGGGREMGHGGEHARVSVEDVGLVEQGLGLLGDFAACRQDGGMQRRLRVRLVEAVELQVFGLLRELPWAQRVGA